MRPGVLSGHCIRGISEVGEWGGSGYPCFVPDSDENSSQVPLLSIKFAKRFY